MDLYLHIGTEKTGTTSIQHFLYENIEKLKEKKIYLSQSIDFPNNRSLVEMFNDNLKQNEFYIEKSILDENQRKIFFQELDKKIQNEFKKASLSFDKMIITSEHFHSVLTNINQIKSLKNFLNKFFKKIKIICYFREQSEVAVSWYSTTIKGGSTQGINKFLISHNVNPDNHYFNYYDFLKKWSDVFGKENIVPIIFNFRNKNNDELIKSFLDQIDNQLIISEFKNFNLRKNLCIHSQLRKYLVLNNIANPLFIENNTMINLKRRELQEIIVRASEGLSEYDQDYELRISLYKKFYNINVEFFSYFFSKKENLFEPPIQMQILTKEEQEKNEELFLINFFRLISKKSKNFMSDNTKTKSVLLSVLKKKPYLSPINISKIHTEYELKFKKKLQHEIILENISLNKNFFIISKDLNKLTIKCDMSVKRGLERVVAVIRICEFTKYFKNALFNLGDSYKSPFSEKTISFCSNNDNVLLIPDHNFVNNFFKVISDLNDLPKIKSNLAVFCGNMIGLSTSKDRLSLFNFGFNNDDILNLFLVNNLKNLAILNKHKITHLQKFFPRNKGFFEINNNKPFNRIPLEKMYFFLVQVDVDGITNSFSGFFHKLYSGRPLLKIRSSLGYKQWYYDRLKPDYHYFDVKSDLSNFREKYFQALEEYKTTKVFPGREFISKMNYDEELQLAADKISFYFK